MWIRFADVSWNYIELQCLKVRSLKRLYSASFVSLWDSLEDFWIANIYELYYFIVSL